MDIVITRAGQEAQDSTWRTVILAKTIILTGALAAGSVAAALPAWADTMIKQTIIIADAFGGVVSKSRVFVTDGFGDTVAKSRVVRTDAFGNKVVKIRVANTDAFGDRIVSTKLVVRPAPLFDREL